MKINYFVTKHIKKKKKISGAGDSEFRIEFVFPGDCFLYPLSYPESRR